jgi:PAS domain S-box-containing protein
MTAGPPTDPAELTLSPSERSLAEKADRYRSLFAYIPNGVFSLDLEGHLTEANGALQELTGRSRPEMLDIDYHELFHRDDIAIAEKAFLAVKERVPQTLEVRLVTLEGDIREIKLSAVPVVVFDQVVGVHGMIEDVTEANGMHRELEAANTAKTLFLANVSHEVRTPLTMIIGATEILVETDLDAGQGQLADMVNRNSQRLLRLVNDILDFSRLEAGKISLLPAPFRLAEVVDELLEWARPRAVAEGLALSATLDAALPSGVCGDALRISQVLSNLVDNALKYTETGSVDITVRLRPGAAPTAGGVGNGVLNVELAVSDTGVGISRHHVELLFDSFTQADPNATRSRNGVGLGLAICRDLVDLMGGEIGAESTPGLGTTFTVVLPLVAVPDTQEQTLRA